MTEAIARMGSRARQGYGPRPEVRSVYDELYGEYLGAGAVLRGGGRRNDETAPPTAAERDGVMRRLGPRFTPLDRGVSCRGIPRRVLRRGTRAGASSRSDALG